MTFSKEKTPCEKRGWKVGDRFRVLYTRHGFKKDQEVVLYRDDGDGAPLFAGSSPFNHCDGNQGTYMDVACVEKIDTGFPDIGSTYFYWDEFELAWRQGTCVAHYGDGFITVDLDDGMPVHYLNPDLMPKEVEEMVKVVGEEYAEVCEQLHKAGWRKNGLS